ncbi:hypothetical protein GCM10010449_44070 [Streptomyces rectiviolaceus]|uniref:Uncharacterized protein n=1 Tax=Streptomyces rectiviolaceus TaxID=332591 RepID=A0ABP6MJX6_9ACTN
MRVDIAEAGKVDPVRVGTGERLGEELGAGAESHHGTAATARGVEGHAGFRSGRKTCGAGCPEAGGTAGGDRAATVAGATVPDKRV